jgi:hypothetical protein
MNLWLYFIKFSRCCLEDNGIIREQALLGRPSVIFEESILPLFVGFVNGLVDAA